jgi:hypothetical protein
MSKLSRGLLLVLWIASLVVAATWGAAAQQSAQVPSGTVLSGPDLGFRVAHLAPGEVAPGEVAGTFVVKINGQWVQVGALLGKPAPVVVR